MTLQAALTKADKARRVRAILDSGAKLIDAADAEWLVAEVFANHPRWAQKSAGGVRRIEVRPMPPYNSRCFFIVRNDGTAVDISFRESLNPATNSARIRAAARCEVERDVHVWKIQNAAPMAAAHCDHIHPFDAIWREFIEKHELSEEHISVVSDPVGRADYFENRRLSHAWQRFHFERATFQWLTPSENITKSNKTEQAAA